MIYLDHNATTPIDPIAADAMTRYIRDEFGNPSSVYPLGLNAKDGVERARQDVASLLGCEHSEVIFTSGGSESNNMALKGLVDFKNPEKFVRLSKCHLGYNSITVNTGGDIFLCNSMPPIGNIQDRKRFKDIWFSKKADDVRDTIRKCEHNCKLMINCFYEDENMPADHLSV